MSEKRGKHDPRIIYSRASIPFTRRHRGKCAQRYCRTGLERYSRTLSNDCSCVCAIYKLKCGLTPGPRVLYRHIYLDVYIGTTGFFRRR